MINKLAQKIGELEVTNIQYQVLLEEKEAEIKKLQEQLKGDKENNDED